MDSRPIRTEVDYKATLKEISALMDPTLIWARRRVITECGA